MPRYNDISHFKLDLVKDFQSFLAPKIPWENITDFTVHKSFCGLEPYPKQLTLLRMIYLETENMTDFDVDTINGWRKTFGKKESIGVPADIWDRIAWLKANGYRRFPLVLGVIGRRAGKGWLGGVIGSESISRMVALGDWQEHYGIQAHKVAYAHCFATTQQQAMTAQFADIKTVVTGNNWLKKWTVDLKDHTMTFRTPADLAYIAELQVNKQNVNYEVATVRVRAHSSNSASSRGHSVFSNYYDEFAHMLVGTGGVRSSEEMYSAQQPSLKQFGKDGFTYIPSSPWSKVGQFYNLYTQGSTLIPEYIERTGAVQVKQLTAKDLDEDAEETFTNLIADPTMLVIQLPSWSTFEGWEDSYRLNGIKQDKALIEYDDDMKRKEAANPTKFRVEFGAQFAEVEDPYLNPDMVDKMFEPWYGLSSEPFNQEERSHGDSSIEYHGHADPGRTNANFAMAICHLEEAPPDQFGNVWKHSVVDFMKVWSPNDFPNHTIDYVQVEDELSEILAKFPSLKEFTFDQWNSSSLIAKLGRDHPRINIHEVTATEKVNQDRYEKFKSAVNLGWVHSYKDAFFDKDAGISLLEQELKFLSEKNGKVVKQDTGPVQTKDLSDAVHITSVRLLDRYLSRWFDMNGIKPQFAKSNVQVIGNQTRVSSVMPQIDPNSELRQRVNSISSRRPTFYSSTRGGRFR